MMYPTTTTDETRIARLAVRLGLALVRGDSSAAAIPIAHRYHLVAAQTRTPVYPGAPAAGAGLADIEDWDSLGSSTPRRRRRR